MNEPTRSDRTMDSNQQEEKPEESARLSDTADYVSNENRQSDVFGPKLPCEMGKYVLQRLLGSGGMGKVYLAEDTTLKRPVAIKLPKILMTDAGSDAHQVQLILREARLAARLNHPNICGVLEIGDWKGKPFIAFEYVDGETLAAVGRRAFPMDETRLLRLFIKLVKAVAYAHQVGVVHRDLKPANIMIDRNDEPIVMDFGVSVALDGTRLTNSGTLIGTPAYMAPEIAKDAKSATSPAADQYSLGVILYELLTERRPFEGLNSWEIIAKLMKTQAVSPKELRPEVRDELSSLVMRMIAKAPKDRFPSLNEVLRELHRLAGIEEPIPSAPITEPLALTDANPNTTPLSVANSSVTVVEANDNLPTTQNLRQLSKIKGLAIGVSVVAFLLVGGFAAQRYYSRQPRDIDKSVAVVQAPPGAPLKNAPSKTAPVAVQSPPVKPVADVKPVSVDRDRQAAQWVLGLGGKVAIRCNSILNRIQDGKELPETKFEIEEIELVNRPIPANASLQVLSELRSLRALQLFNTGISDQQLRQISDVPNVTFLGLDRNLGINDASLKHIGGQFPRLENLGLAFTSVTDDGLVHLSRLQQLQLLSLMATKVSGPGLRDLRSIASLRHLNLSNSNLTDDNVSFLEELTALNHIELIESKLSQASQNLLKSKMPRCVFVFLTEDQQREAFEKEVSGLVWKPLEAIQLSANGGTTLRQLGDRTLIAEGIAPAHSTYTVVGKVAPAELKALRLDVLRDAKYASLGPGRGPGGNFVLTGIEVAHQSKPDVPARTVALRRCFADYTQNGHDPTRLVAGNGSWGVYRPFSPVRDQSLVVELEESIPWNETSTITVKLKQESEWHNQALGRFKLSASNGVPMTPSAADLIDGVGIKFVKIPAGDFLMGRQQSDKNSDDNQKPQHKVTISKPFYFGKHEVTVAQFELFINETKYATVAERVGSMECLNEATRRFEPMKGRTWKNPGFSQTGGDPVVGVSNDDALAFCNWLSIKEGVVYRLPTEAEWEYACRAGADTVFQTGDDADGAKKAGNTGFSDADGFRFTAPVGRFPSNRFGLHDMHGNVWEWCSDWAGRRYSDNPLRDPRGAMTGYIRVLRGGSWYNPPTSCSFRYGNYRDARYSDVGFRVVRNN